MVEADEAVLSGDKWGAVLCTASFREQDAKNDSGYAAIEMCRNRLAEFHISLNEAEKVVSKNTLSDLKRMKRDL